MPPGASGVSLAPQVRQVAVDRPGGDVQSTSQIGNGGRSASLRGLCQETQDAMPAQGHLATLLGKRIISLSGAPEETVTVIWTVTESSGGGRRAERA